MAVVYKEIPEGELITSTGIAASFDAIKVEVNDLDETSVDKNTLHREHLPSASLSARTTGISGSDHTYTDTAFPYPGWNTTAGWATIGLEVPVASLFLSRAKTAGILVLANINVKRITGVHGGVTAFHPSWMAVFALQYRAGGVWKHLARTERYVEMDTGDDDDFITDTPLTNTATYTTQLLGKDVSIRTLITDADNPSGMSVDSVRLMVSVLAQYAGNAASVGTYETTVTLRQGNISAIALQGEEIV